MKKWLLGAMACSSLLLASCEESPEVASTEAGRIRQDELYERMKNEVTQSGLTYGEQMLQQILLEDILENAYGEAVTEEDVDAAFETEAEAYGGVEAFEEMLETQGLSVEEVRNNIRTSLYVKEAVTERTDLSEEEVVTAYEEYTVNSTVAHILVEEEEVAQQIIDELNEGADFGELVAEHSLDTGTVEANGEMPLEPGRFVPEFEEAALELEEGEITQEPVESEFGYHIIKLVEQGEKGTLEEERAMIENMIIDSQLQNQEVIQAAISEIVSDANVIISDEDLQGAMQQFLQTPPVEEEIPEEDTEPAEDTETETDTEGTDTEESETDTENTETDTEESETETEETDTSDEEE